MTLCRVVIYQIRLVSFNIPVDIFFVGVNNTGIRSIVTRMRGTYVTYVATIALYSPANSLYMLQLTPLVRNVIINCSVYVPINIKLTHNKTIILFSPLIVSIIY